jgi:microcystin-dependent protein
MAESLTELARALAADPAVTLRISTITALESTGSRRAQTELTGSTWISRDAGTSLTVGDRCWILQQGNVSFIGGRLVGGSSQPVGSIINFASATTVPPGWLACNGQAVSRTDYARLFAVCGTTYGSGDGSTTFNIPNLNDRTVVGPGGRSVGASGGAATVSLSVANMPAHNHNSSGGHSHSIVGTGTTTVASGSGATVTNSTTGNTGGTGTHTHDTVGSGTAHENMPPFLVLPYIIRAL